MTAHQMSYAKISLIAGGGRGYDPNMIGYLFWPKFGFDAPIEDREVEGAPLLANCQTVQEIVAIDPQWWRDNGSQRWMKFDLAPRSVCRSAGVHSGRGTHSLRYGNRAV